MNFKWYISCIVAALALLGIGADRTALPNQEIVMQFGTHAEATQDAEQVLQSVRQKLHEIGIKDIQVVASIDGSITLTYYSNMEVTAVKALLNQVTDVAVDKTFVGFDTPTNPLEDQNDRPFELNVSEISKASDNGLGLNGTLLEYKSAHDRYVHPVVYFDASAPAYGNHKNLESAKTNRYADTALLTDIATYKIPEVRAGPSA